MDDLEHSEHLSKFAAIAEEAPSGYELTRTPTRDGWEYTVRTPDGTVHTRWALGDVQRLLARLAAAVPAQQSPAVDR
ncbi:hypothetical protein DEF28_01940 [Marinitenerispora sediminis]|nr:hypothetical protein DEF28_01940 [Marinitenerispora sediminis]